MLEGKWYLSFIAFDTTVGHSVAKYLPLTVVRTSAAETEEEAAYAAAVRLWESDLVQTAFLLHAQIGVEHPPRNPQLVYVRGLQVKKPLPTVAEAAAA